MQSWIKTEDGEFEHDTPRDRKGSFKPELVKKMSSTASQGQCSCHVHDIGSEQQSLLQLVLKYL